VTSSGIGDGADYLDIDIITSRRSTMTPFRILLLGRGLARPPVAGGGGSRGGVSFSGRLLGITFLNAPTSTWLHSAAR